MAGPERPIRGKIYSPLLKTLADASDVTESDYELIDRFKDGDRDAGHLLFVKHCKMILKVIIDLTDGRWYDDDCLHAGAVGLYEAALRFDKTLGYTFLTYAVHYIRKYVLLEVQNDALPTAGISFGRDFKERMYRFIGYKMVGKSVEEIAELMHLKEAYAVKLSNAVLSTSRPVSLNSIHNEEDEEGVDYELTGMPSVASTEDVYLDEELQRLIEDIVAELDERSQFILNHTLCVNDHGFMDRGALSKHFGVTMLEFSKFRREAYRKLKQALIKRRA